MYLIFNVCNIFNVGADDMDINIKGFLDFYTLYTHAEDDALEMKLAKGLSALGKITKMKFSLTGMKIGVRDDRAPAIMMVMLKVFNITI